MILTDCKNRGMEVLGLIFWSFSRSVDSGTPNSALSTEHTTVSQPPALWVETSYITHGYITQVGCVETISPSARSRLITHYQTCQRGMCTGVGDGARGCVNICEEGEKK